MWSQTTPLKDRNKPKGPMTAYSCFVQVVREECKKKYPNDTVKFSEFSKICAERWKIMNDKEKQRFHDMAAADKERYNKEISEYVPPDGFPKGKKRKVPRDPFTPKRSLSPFFLFSDEFRGEIRAEHPDWSVAAVAKELGRRWETCENKSKYEALSQKDKERYEDEMKRFRNGTFVPPKKESTGASSSASNGLKQFNSPNTSCNNLDVSSSSPYMNDSNNNTNNESLMANGLHDQSFNSNQQELQQESLLGQPQNHQQHIQETQHSPDNQSANSDTQLLMNTISDQQSCDIIPQ